MDNDEIYNYGNAGQNGSSAENGQEAVPETGYEEYGRMNGCVSDIPGGPYPPRGGYQQELEEPVSMGEWLISLLLIMFVPCVNIVLMFVWAFSKKEKKSKSNFFKAQLIVTGISLVVYFFIAIAVVMLFAAATINY